MKKASISHGACAGTANAALPYLTIISFFTFIVIVLFSPFFSINTAHAQQTSTIKKASSMSGTLGATLGTSNAVSAGSISNPVLLVIPKISVNAPVKAMGLTPTGAMAVPNNFTDVGWYSNGTEPGNVGNAVFGAHVDNGTYNPTKNGVFKNLHTLATGDDLYIVDANGTTLHFTVTATRVYPYNSTDTSAIFGQTDAAHLNIITCYGTWLPSAGTYSERFVVFTTLVSVS